MRFRDYFSLKHIIFALVLIILMLFFAVRQSNNTVKVSFGDTSLSVTSAKYTMSILYSDIADAQLTELAEPGEEVADSYDDDILRSGEWRNDAWGNYIIVVDLDVDTCILLELNDGRTLVFSRKNDKTTIEDFETLQSYLN